VFTPVIIAREVVAEEIVSVFSACSKRAFSSERFADLQQGINEDGLRSGCWYGYLNGFNGGDVGAEDDGAAA
jgi:hypothetical protein